MLNHIWTLLVAVGILWGVTASLIKVQTGESITKTVNGKEVTEFVRYKTTEEKVKALSEAGNKFTKEAFNSVALEYDDPATGKKRSGAVGIAFGFIGIMALWLGFMRIAEASGLIALLARAISPLFRLIFPSIPRDHPASGAILMNFAANMLGLDNAATPLGIKAMKELQSLNGQKDTASNAMIMFICLNVSSLVILPASIIGYRVQANSQRPTDFWIPMLIATTIGTLSAFIMCKVIERFTKDTPPAPPETATGEEAA
ncbi:MAG: hypothetical protein K1X53_07150 [Candidatus Sumerlaeaceae bacterium]|nr:hypothetical protein [Candidatus Sumerlaeaceae bacterium]